MSDYKKQFEKWIITQKSNLKVQKHIIESQEKELKLKQEYLETLKSLYEYDKGFLKCAEDEYKTL